MKTTIMISRRAIPKGSTHSFRHRHTGKMITKQNRSDELYEYQDFVAYLCKKAGVKVVQGPVELNVTYYFQRPLSHFKGGDRTKGLKDSAPQHHMQTPDRDKLDRAIQDALEGIAYDNDKQVYRGTSAKLWTTDADWICLEITQ